MKPLTHALFALTLTAGVFFILACISIMNPVSQITGLICFAAGFLMRKG